MSPKEDYYTILIVDDNPENLRVLKTILNDAGYKVIIASNGQDAIERARRIEPVLILLDVKMPGMDGFEVCTRLRGFREFEKTPIIFVTAATDAESISHGFQAGGSDYITKPIRKLELLARVKNHIQAVDLNKYLERQIAERTKELKESEERYRIAIEGTQDGLWDLNLRTYEAVMSNRYDTMLGYAPGELPRTGESWSSMLHPDDKQKAMDTLDKYLNREIDYYESTFRMRTKSGEYRWITGRGKAEWDEDGKPIRIIGFNTDITERKEAEMQLEEKNAELRSNLEHIKRINTELEIAKGKAEESNRLKTEFLHNLSHEIRTPMNGIIGFSDMLSRAHITEEKRQFYTKIIQSSSYQLLRIIDDILEISTLETKQITLNEEKFCLNDLMMELFSVFNLRAQEKNIAFYVRKGQKDASSYIVSDKSKLNKILGNLLENAFKYTAQGTIEFGYQFEDDKLVFFVKDTGIGISHDKRKVIFERFTQEHSELTKKSGGLGLGLSISKENAQLLGGDISLESKKGEGSAFYVTIPLNRSQGTLTTAGTSEPGKKSYTVLVAEDEQVNYLFVEALLESLVEYDIQLIHARNGKEAIEKCSANGVDLVLMDVKMPVMDGNTATREIKKMHPELPVIALTAYTMKDDKQLALDSGCDDFVSKPLVDDKFITLIRKYFG